MFSNPHAPVTSVTSAPLFFLDDAVDELVNSLWPIIDKREDPFWESLGQKRADKSASHEVVKKLLLTAAAGGMTQKDFETSAGHLRPARRSDLDSKLDRFEGFNGTLWHYYMTSEARMSLLTLAEYSEFFHDKGWLTKKELADLRDYSNKKLEALVAVKKMFPPGAPPDWELERTARTFRSTRR